MISLGWLALEFSAASGLRCGPSLCVRSTCSSVRSKPKAEITSISILSVDSVSFTPDNLKQLRLED